MLIMGKRFDTRDHARPKMSKEGSETDGDFPSRALAHTAAVHATYE